MPRVAFCRKTKISQWACDNCGRIFEKLPNQNSKKHCDDPECKKDLTRKRSAKQRLSNGLNEHKEHKKRIQRTHECTRCEAKTSNYFKLCDSCREYIISQNNYEEYSVAL